MKFSFIFLLLFFSINVSIFSSENKRVKIPFFKYDALYECHGNENDSSYISEFLENINRYSDYEFEYVELDRAELASALAEGKIDLIPFMGRENFDGNNFLFSDIPTAIGSTVFASNRLPDFNNLKIGLLKQAPDSLKDSVFNYVKNQGINASYFYYDDLDTLISDIYKNKLDVLTTIDFTIPDDFYVLATIENTFFYLACAEKNKKTFDDFNTALSNLFLLNPSFLSSIRSRFIPSSRYSINKLTSKEEAYINNHKEIKVVVLTNDAPYSYFSKGEFHGIIIDQINEVGKSSGLKISYVPANSYERAMEMIKSGEVDVIYNVNDLLVRSDILSLKTTNPLLSQKFVNVKNEGFSSDEKQFFVEIKGIQYSKEYIDKHCRVDEKISVDTIDECFQLLEKNRNYFTYMPLLSAEYYMQTHLFSNLEISNEGYSVSVSLGICRQLESELAGILDKSIYTLTTSMFENFMERNMDESSSFVYFIKKHLLLFCIIAAVFILLLSISIFLFIFIQTKRKKDKQIKQAMNLANRDSMTGLFNHIAFEKKVSGILSHQEENERGVFIMIDIDDFKKVNDSLGHAKGDYVIVSIANLIISTFRGGDLKGRMGGDEFAVFMKNVSDIESVKHKMRIFQIAIKDYFEKSNLGIKVTCSIGISSCKGKQDGEIFKKIYKAADEGLYMVKKSGKNAFYIVESEN